MTGVWSVRCGDHLCLTRDPVFAVAHAQQLSETTKRCAQVEKIDETKGVLREGV